MGPDGAPFLTISVRSLTLLTGHCANLFPHHPLLSTPDLWIAHLSEPTPPSSRLTFTLPLLSASRRLAFICTSASSALANVLDQEKDDSEKVPAGRVRLGGHPVVWFVDEGAREGGEYPVSEFWEED